MKDGLDPATGPNASGAPEDQDLLFAFRAGRMAVLDSGEGAALPRMRDLSAHRQGLLRELYLGRLAGRRAWTVELDGDGRNLGAMSFRGLRALFDRLPEAEVWAAARAVQLVAWDRDHRFCGRCGGLTEAQALEYNRRCPRCALAHYPRLAPAVIVLVHREDEILLGRGPNLPAGMFSTLAGFVEPGESLEETVAREIHEEVGVEVTDIRYFGSQPWPFPNSLMIGFLARWSANEIRLGLRPDGEPELEEADWFKLNALPTIPPRISIARALIDTYIASRATTDREIPMQGSEPPRPASPKVE